MVLCAYSLPVMPISVHNTDAYDPERSWLSRIKMALASANGIHWKKTRNKWGINRSNWPHGSDSTSACTFWSEYEGPYVAFIRIRVNPKDPSKGQVGRLR